MARIEDFQVLQTNLLSDESTGEMKTAPKEAIESLAPYLVRYPTRFLSIGGDNLGLSGSIQPREIFSYDLAANKWSKSEYPPFDYKVVESGYNLQVAAISPTKFLICSILYGQYPTRYYPKAFIFDPYTADKTRQVDRIQSLGTFFFACRSGSSLLPLKNGKQLLRIGGHNAAPQPGYEDREYPENALYNIKGDDWVKVDLPIPLLTRMLSVVLEDGRILITGGVEITNGNITNDPEVDYEHAQKCRIISSDLKEATWTGDMLEPRFSHGGCVMANGNVFVCGGHGIDGSTLQSCEEYDIGNGTWSALPEMPGVMGDHTCTLIKDGKIFIAGSFQNRFLTMTYDPATKTFTRLDDFPAASVYAYKAIPVYD
jgi:hypothetical protein